MLSPLVTRKIFALFTVSVPLLLAGGPVLAHAQLTTAEPKANASVSAPSAIVLHFNEALEAKLSNFKLTDIDGKAVVVKPAAAPDNKSISAMPSAPLTPGLYTVSWTAVGDDGHPMKGTYSFSVK